MQEQNSNESERRSEGLIGELAKKAVASSVGALLSSEEGIRSLIGTILPREIGAYFAKELSVLRGEILKALMEELSRYLSRVDMAKELKMLLDGLAFDVHVTVRVSQCEGTGPTLQKGAKTTSRPSRRSS